MNPTKLTRRTALAIALLTVALTAVAAQDTGDEGELVWRVYPVQYLDLREAGLEIEQAVPEMLEDREYAMRPEKLGQNDSGQVTGYLRFRTSAALHERIAAALAELDHPPATHLFQVFILAASDRDMLPTDLPKAALDALVEMQALLPFKGYALIESALFRSSGESQVSVGPDFNLQYAFDVDPRQDKPLNVRRFRLLSPRGDGWFSHIDTSFSAAIGETVVVGTSRPMKGDAALVVLLTALE